MTDLTSTLRNAGVDFDHLDTWIAERTQPCDDLDAWYANNPHPHSRKQTAELTGIIKRRMALTDQYMQQLPDSVKQRIRDALATEAQRPHPDTTGNLAPAGGNPAYVKQALDDEYARLAAATEGNRNDTLLKVACNVFEFAKGGHARQHDEWQRLHAYGQRIGLPSNEIDGTLKSAWNRVGPRTVPAPRNQPSNRTTINIQELI